MQFMANDAVHLGIGEGDMTWELMKMHRRGAGVKKFRFAISLLKAKAARIKGAPIQAWRCTGLQAAHAQAKTLQPLSQRQRLCLLRQQLERDVRCRLMGNSGGKLLWRSHSRTSRRKTQSKAKQQLQSQLKQ